MPSDRQQGENLRPGYKATRYHPLDNLSNVATMGAQICFKSPSTGLTQINNPLFALGSGLYLESSFCLAPRQGLFQKSTRHSRTEGGFPQIARNRNDHGPATDQVP